MKRLIISAVIAFGAFCIGYTATDIWITFHPLPGGQVHKCGSDCIPVRLNTEHKVKLYGVCVAFFDEIDKERRVRCNDNATFGESP